MQLTDYTMLKSRLTMITVSAPTRTAKGPATVTMIEALDADCSDRVLRNAIEENIKEAKRMAGI